MDAIKIKVADYYGNPSYYSVMPNEIFDALELASLKGETETDVDKALFTQMVDNYKKKMALCGIIKHHNKNEKPCVLGFWHFLTSERIAGFSASLSAINLENQGFTQNVHENVHETSEF